MICGWRTPPAGQKEANTPQKGAAGTPVSSYTGHYSVWRFGRRPILWTKPESLAMTRYRWAEWGDINAFFGLMLDNVTVLLILVSSISVIGAEQRQDDFRFSSQFVLTHMVPGTALGVLLGDLVYTWMAFRLARRTG